MYNFKELQVWHKAIALAARIYQVTEMLPKTEKYNLISQMQRAVVSIPSNIAEGCGRNSKAMFANFLDIAIGSSYELETQIILSGKLSYFNEKVTKRIVGANERGSKDAEWSKQLTQTILILDTYYLILKQKNTA